MIYFNYYEISNPITREVFYRFEYLIFKFNERVDGETQSAKKINTHKNTVFSEKHEITHKQDGGSLHFWKILPSHHTIFNIHVRRIKQQGFGCGN